MESAVGNGQVMDAELPGLGGELVDGAERGEANDRHALGDIAGDLEGAFTNGSCWSRGRPRAWVDPSRLDPFEVEVEDRSREEDAVNEIEDAADPGHDVTGVFGAETAF